MDFIAFSLKATLLPQHPQFGRVADHVGCIVAILGENEEYARDEMIQFLKDQHILIREELGTKMAEVPDRPTGNMEMDIMFKSLVLHGRHLQFLVKDIDPLKN